MKNSAISPLCVDLGQCFCHMTKRRLYYFVYRYLYSTSHGINQIEALSVHFSSRKKVRLKAREREGKGSRENRQAKMKREVILE